MAEPVSTSQIETSVVFLQEKLKKLSPPPLTSKHAGKAIAVLLG